MQNVSEELCACRKELGTQTTALKRATSDREELAKDRAALEVKLSSAERKASGLMEELASLRSVCKLFFYVLSDLHMHCCPKNYRGSVSVCVHHFSLQHKHPSSLLKATFFTSLIVYFIKPE